MPRQSNGIYVQPTGTAAVNLATIDPAAFNTLISDIGTEITGSLPRNGSAAAAAAIPMGGFKITGLGNPTVATDGATKAYVDALLPSGTVVLFAQAAAPTGWTQITTTNDAALRVVSGATGGTLTNGTAGLSTWAGLGTQSHALSWNEMPTHSHGVNETAHSHTIGLTTTGIVGTGGGTYAAQSGSGVTTNSATTGISIQNAGSGWGHSHSLNSFSYFDVIVASKN